MHFSNITMNTSVHKYQHLSISCLKHCLVWIMTMPLPTCKLIIGSNILSSLSCLIMIDQMQRKWKKLDGSNFPPPRAKCLWRLETVKWLHIERTTQGAQEEPPLARTCEQEVWTPDRSAHICPEHTSWQEYWSCVYELLWKYFPFQGGQK